MSRQKIYRLLIASGVLGTVGMVMLGFFVVTFVVYFFNLDMKLTSHLYDFMQVYYDKINRDQHL